MSPDFSGVRDILVELWTVLERIIFQRQEGRKKYSSMVYLILVLAILFSAYRVMRAARLMNVTIWLAVSSALVAILLYLLGAPEVAVIELSVGAGLVTVLFVYAFSITGEVTLDEKTLLPRILVWILVLAGVGLLAWFLLPIEVEKPLTIDMNFPYTLWKERGLDVLVQIVLIFAGVMGLLGLLSTSPQGSRSAQAETLAEELRRSQEDDLPEVQL
jgi:uncharacterized MnhB-related membrane protein